MEKSHCVNFFSVSVVSILTLVETFQKSHDGKRSNMERLGADLVAALLMAERQIAIYRLCDLGQAT